MVKRFLSLVLVLALSLTMFTFVNVSAAQDITLEIAGEPYSKYTIPGTVINTTSVASLSAGQEVVYFLNGVEAGRANAAGNFNFTSVAGTNEFQVKIMNGETVVAESNVVTLNFTELFKTKSIKTSPLSTLDNSKVFTNEAVFSTGWATFTNDPDENCTGTVMHVKEPTPAATRVGLPLSATSTGVEIVDFEFYGEHYTGGLYSASISANCGCSHGSIAAMDWPSGTAVNGVSRSYKYPKKQWIKMSMVIDNYTNTYDLYADGVQIVSARPFCTNDKHTVEDPIINAVQLPSPGWLGTVTVGTDSAGNAIKEQHHGEFYLKNLDYYTCNTASVIASVPESVVAGSKFVVNVVNGKFAEGQQFIYNVNGVDSEPTEAEQYVCNEAKSGTNTIIVKAVKDDKVLAVSEPVTAVGYYAPNESAVIFNDVKTTDAGHKAGEYSIIDVSGTYPDRDNVQKFTITHASTSYYPQSGTHPTTGVGGRGYLASAVCAASDCLTISYDLNVEQLDGTITNTLDYYYNNNGSTTDSYPIIMMIKDKEISFGDVLAKFNGDVVSVPFAKGVWNNIKYVFVKESQTVYFMLNDTVVHSLLFSELPGSLSPFGKNIMFVIFGSNANAEGYTNTTYLDNYSLGYGVNTYEISVSTSAGTSTVPSGMKVNVKAEYKPSDAKVNYYCNGVLVQANTSDKEAFVTAQPDANIVYAELVDKYGTVLATSEETTFYAYDDVVNTDAYNRSGSTDILKKHNKHSDGIKNGYEVANPYGECEYAVDTTTFADDEHGSVLKIASSVANTNLAPLINVLSNNRTHAAMANSKGLYSMSIDVYPESVNGSAFQFANALKTSEKSEVYFYFFKIVSGKILVSKDGLNTYTNVVEIPCEKKWYTLEVICNPFEGTYILAVNDVVYSVIDKSGTIQSPAFSNTGNMYYDITLNGSKDAEKPNVVYLDNVVISYSSVPAHSAVKYTNGANVVTKRSDISAAEDLTIKFVANKGEFANVTCIATVLENNGELVCLATQDVTFTEEKTSENVSLTLTNLPDSIATGGYTVNVMLWDKVTQTPIVTKVVLPN